MKRLQILVLSLLTFSVAFCQPQALKKGGTKTEVSQTPTLEKQEALGGKYLTDTVNANFVLEDQEGYLKRVKGRLVTKYFVPSAGNAIIVEQKGYNLKWEAIKEETVYDVKQIPK